jgi:long-chain acyl-CoA synthetase
VDSKKDMIIAGGYNIYPREIDEVLFQHPKIADDVIIQVSGVRFQVSGTQWF